jgi:hypothetical protein
MPAAAAAHVAPPPAPPDRPPPPVHALLSFDGELDEELLLDEELVLRSQVEDRDDSLRVDHESTSFPNPNASSQGYQLSRSAGSGFASSASK